MLTKAIVLIIIGVQGGSPVSKAVGPFATKEDCQAMGQVLMAAAMAQKFMASAVCVQTPFVLKDNEG